MICSLLSIKINLIHTQIGEMATEESKLLGKSSGKTFNYLSTATINVAPKSKECVVVLPKISETSNNNDG